MPLDSPLTSYSDATPQKRTITPDISLIEPHDRPMLSAIGGLDGASSKFRLVNKSITKVEWLEDELFALSGSLAASIATDTTSVSVADGTIFQEGDILQVDSEYIWVSDVSGDTLTVTRNYGGTLATHADAATLTLVGQARLEGDESDDRGFVDRTAPYNYTQIFHHEIKVARTQNQLAQYGIAREFDYQAEKAVPGLIRLIERTLFHGQRKAGSATTPRAMGGFGTFVTDNTASGASLSQAAFENAAKAAYRDGGMGPWLAPLSPDNIQKVKNFYDNTSYLRVEPSQSIVGMDIEAVRTPFGQIELIPDRWAPDDTIYLIDPKHAGMMTYYPFTQEPLAKGGDYEKGVVVGEFTLLVRHDKAHAKLTSVS